MKVQLFGLAAVAGVVAAQASSSAVAPASVTSAAAPSGTQAWEDYCEADGDYEECEDETSSTTHVAPTTTTASAPAAGTTTVSAPPAQTTEDCEEEDYTTEEDCEETATGWNEWQSGTYTTGVVTVTTPASSYPVSSNTPVSSQPVGTTTPVYTTPVVTTSYVTAPPSSVPVQPPTTVTTSVRPTYTGAADKNTLRAGLLAIPAAIMMML